MLTEQYSIRSRSRGRNRLCRLDLIAASAEFSIVSNYTNNALPLFRFHDNFKLARKELLHDFTYERNREKEMEENRGRIDIFFLSFSFFCPPFLFSPPTTRPMKMTVGNGGRRVENRNKSRKLKLHGTPVELLREQNGAACNRCTANRAKCFATCHPSVVSSPRTV